MPVSRTAERFTRFCSGLILVAALMLQSSTIVLLLIAALVIGCAWPGKDFFGLVFTRATHKWLQPQVFINKDQVMFNNALVVQLLALGLTLISISATIAGWVLIAIVSVLCFLAAAGFCVASIAFALLMSLSNKLQHGTQSA